MITLCLLRSPLKSGRYDMTPIQRVLLPAEIMLPSPWLRWGSCWSQCSPWNFTNAAIVKSKFEISPISVFEAVPSLDSSREQRFQDGPSGHRGRPDKGGKRPFTNSDWFRCLLIWPYQSLYKLRKMKLKFSVVIWKCSDSEQVWASNLEEEFKEICKVVQDYQFVGWLSHFARRLVLLLVWEMSWFCFCLFLYDWSPIFPHRRMI